MIKYAKYILVASLAIGGVATSNYHPSRPVYHNLSNNQPAVTRPPVAPAAPTIAVVQAPVAKTSKPLPPLPQIDTTPMPQPEMVYTQAQYKKIPVCTKYTIVGQYGLEDKTICN